MSRLQARYNVAAPPSQRPEVQNREKVKVKAERQAVEVVKRFQSLPNWQCMKTRQQFQQAYTQSKRPTDAVPFDALWPPLKAIVESHYFVAFLRQSQRKYRRVSREQLRAVYHREYVPLIVEPENNGTSSGAADFGKVLTSARLAGKLFELDGYVYVGDTETALAEALAMPLNRVEEARRRDKKMRRPSYCEVCDLDCSNLQQLHDHLCGRRHKVQQTVCELRDPVVKSQLITDKYNVTVSIEPRGAADYNPSTGVYSFELEVGEKLSVNLCITNKSPAQRAALFSAASPYSVLLDEFLYFFKVDQLNFNDQGSGLLRRKHPVMLDAGATLRIQISCLPQRWPSRAVVPIMVVGRYAMNDFQFRILRFIKIEYVHDKQMYQSLKPRSAFTFTAVSHFKRTPFAAKVAVENDFSEEEDEVERLSRPLGKLQIASASRSAQAKTQSFKASPTHTTKDASASSRVQTPATSTQHANAFVQPHEEFIDGKRLIHAPPLKPVKSPVANGLHLVPIDEHPVTREARRLHATGLRLGANTVRRSAADEILHTILMQKVDESNVSQRFELLLHLEEVQMDLDIQRYAVEHADLKRAVSQEKYYFLQVPGVLENRPCVIRGDLLLVTLSDKANVVYEAVVDDVDGDRLKLLLPAEFVFIDKKSDATVHFQVDRLPLRFQHEMLQQFKQIFAPSTNGANQRLNIFSRDAANLDVAAVYQDALRVMLFPSRGRFAAFSRQPSMVTLQPFFNRSLNEEQQRCVRNIVIGTHLPLPFLIFGPPGTGKTVTLSEAVKQVYNCHPNAFVLVCAPENTSADHLVQTICSENSNVEPRKVLRLYTASRHKRVPDFVSQSTRCTVDFLDAGYPTTAALMSYKIVITTLNTASRLAFSGFPSNHFSHLFIDEAGHAMESEVYVPIARLLDLTGPGGHLIMAGDPRQLGVTVRSAAALKYHLECSFLERLMNCSLYFTESCIETINRNLDHDPDSLKPLNVPTSAAVDYDANLLVKLRRNYRSHDAIIAFSRKRFYHGELLACADDSAKVRFLGWEKLPNKNYPVIFHPVIGCDEQEGNSPSYFNRHEALVIDSYLQALLTEKRGAKVEPKDIGIITPYRGQNAKICKLIESRGYNNVGKNLTASSRSDVGILVGTVEEFQGQERTVIIVSTVRSSEKLQQADFQYQVGLVDRAGSDDREMNLCSKRLNVALTRAKSLLIVTGNPFILEKDHNWNLWLEQCHQNGAWAVNRKQVEMLRSNAMVSEALVDDSTVTTNDISSREMQEEPQWVRRE